MNGTHTRTISEAVDEGHGFRAKARSGEQEVELRLIMAVCDNPDCMCRDVTLYLSPAAGGWSEPHEEVSATVSADTGQILELTSGCTEALRASLQELLDGGLVGALRERWQRVKLQAAPDAWRERDWSWWEPGMLVRWRDAYPGEFDDLVTVAGKRFLVDEMYCCAPDCTCGKVHLTFVPVREPASDAGEPLDLSVDLESWAPHGESGARRQPSLLPYWEAYCALPEVRQRTRERRGRLREVGAELYRRAEPRLPAREPARVVKIGRNDPCPCGSGKKYKKCCGRVG